MGTLLVQERSPGSGGCCCCRRRHESGGLSSPAPVGSCLRTSLGRDPGSSGGGGGGRCRLKYTNEELTDGHPRVPTTTSVSRCEGLGGAAGLFRRAPLSGSCLRTSLGRDPGSSGGLAKTQYEYDPPEPRRAGSAGPPAETGRRGSGKRRAFGQGAARSCCCRGRANAPLWGHARTWPKGARCRQLGCCSEL